ncbi:MAG: hypothetical protein ACP5N1_06215 [Candidatus Woesearchaeota archaeon]
MYSDFELEQIREIIGGKVSIDEIRLAKLKKAVENNEVDMNILGNLASLYDTELFKKISEDKIFEKLNIFGLFPETYKAAYIDNNLEYTHQEAGRGIIFITNKSIIKRVQSPQENDIVKKTALIGGPIQYPTINNYLTEEHIHGQQLNRMRNYDANKMIEHGRDVGTIFQKLHDMDIIYNDFSISDDIGHCHILIPEIGKVRLYDFGTSIDISNHPNYTDEEIISYYRTLPFGYKILTVNDEKRLEMINECRQDLNKLNKDQMKQKDISFINEGLNLLYGRIGSKLAGAFEEGLIETYK